MPAEVPSRLGFPLGYARLGVHSTKWEQLFRTLARDVTWRCASINVDRDLTTGHRRPSYDMTYEIKGVFETTGGELISLPPGFVQRGDAVFRCFAGVEPKDQIHLSESNQYYEVMDVERKDEYIKQLSLTSFCYRICDLTELTLHMEV